MGFFLKNLLVKSFTITRTRVTSWLIFSLDGPICCRSRIAVCLIFVVAGLTAAFSYYATPKAQRVGYQPDQPIDYDHALHVDQLGMDCRYCHSSVDKSASAGVPTANTCWNCHEHVQKGSPKLAPLRAAMGVDEDHAPIEGAVKKPIKWVRIHKSPDYVYFDHSAHVNRGVSCQSCHGDIHKMEKVHHDKSLSMAFCLGLPPRTRKSPAPSRGSVQFRLQC